MGGNLCPDCAKFVSLDLGEPEVDSLEIDNDGNITGDVRLVLNCANCSTELKEANLSFDEIPDNLSKHLDAHQEKEESVTLEIDEGESRMDDYFSPGVDKKGKRIPMRFRKHYYTAEIGAVVTCSCGEKIDVEISVEEQASGFDDLN